MAYKRKEDEHSEEILTPSYHGRLCRHNGDNPNYEIACDECDFFLACFPELETGPVYNLEDLMQ